MTTRAPVMVIVMAPALVRLRGLRVGCDIHPERPQQQKPKRPQQQKTKNLPQQKPKLPRLRWSC
jgi:hypothetical protein